MGGLRDLVETLSELFGWTLKTLLGLFRWLMGTLLPDVLGLLVPRFIELIWLLMAGLYFRLSYLGDGPTNLTNVVTAIFSAAFLIAWAILRMTRILGDLDRRLTGTKTALQSSE